ncbi:hypothetical protein LguiA_008528 [Lonicera macranthoides]
MSIYSLRFRRALSLSSSLLKPFSSISSPPPPLSSTNAPNPKTSNPTSNAQSRHLNHPFQSTRSFRSSTISLLSSRPRYTLNNDDDKISPDAILFEGCDYNHWLITMDFPKDPKPTPEEMVETYVQTAAKVLGSVEEAKRRIYACSTTTYQGFQVEVTEEMSEKFRGKCLPGVVFILPDSYIDPVNKEYGGDKYENGKITPRPPPIQYGRQGGRYNDRNRSRVPYQQGNSGYDNQGGPMRGDNRNFGAQQNPPPPQTYGPPGANLRRDPMPMSNNAPVGQDNYQRPPYQANYNQGDRGNYRPPQEQRDFQTGGQRSYAPPPQGGNYNQGPGGNFGQGAGGGYGQGVGGSSGPGVAGFYGQGAGGSSGPGAGGFYGQGAGGSSGQGVDVSSGQGAVGTYGQGAGVAHGRGAGVTYGQGASGGYGQGAGGSYGQGGVGGYGQGASGSYGQGVGGAHGQELGSSSSRQNDLGHGENQRFSETEPRENVQGQQRNNATMGETGIGQAWISTLIEAWKANAIRHELLQLLLSRLDFLVVHISGSEC